jgi:protein PsiE
METKNRRYGVDFLARVLQYIQNSALVLIGLVLSYFLFREIYYILLDAIAGNTNVHDILEKVLAFFLYFAFIATVVKYFTEGYHFPIRYLLYIGVTATLRFIIVNREDYMENLVLSVVVLLLLAGYMLIYKSEHRV